MLQLRIPYTIHDFRFQAKITNSKMWELEDQKRLTQKHLEKLSILAKNVYKLNDDRADIKLRINKMTKSNIREVKRYAKY